MAASTQGIDNLFFSPWFGSLNSLAASLSRQDKVILLEQSTRMCLSIKEKKAKEVFLFVLLLMAVRFLQHFWVHIMLSPLFFGVSSMLYSFHLIPKKKTQTKPSFSFYPSTLLDTFWRLPAREVRCCRCALSLLGTRNKIHLAARAAM